MEQRLFPVEAHNALDVWRKRNNVDKVTVGDYYYKL